jgi:hypothetical protein
LRNGVVWTAAPRLRCTALCVDGTRIAWVGDEEGADHYADNAEAVLDLDGRFVGPAFVDAHVHAAQTGLSAASLDLRSTSSCAEALSALERYASRCGADLVLGFGWDETRWPERRAFTRDEVDRATGGKAAYLARVDVHSAVLSSAFADRAPQVRDAEGWRSDGRVERSAHHVARQLVNELVRPSQRRDAIAAALRAAVSAGIGSIHELGAPHLSRPDDFATIAELGSDQPGPFVVRYWGELEAVDTALELGCRGAAGDLCVDGAFGSRTAALSSPYADADTSGHLYLTAEDICRHVVACTQAGLQAGFHCIGDRAVGTTVEGFTAAAGQVGVPALRAARHRLEHVELIDAAGIASLRHLGVTASVQPAFDAAWGGPSDMYAARLGGRRSTRTNPFRALADAGVELAFGSDTPVTPFDPWGSVRAAAWHRNAEFRLTPAEAFTAHTRGGWRAAAMDDTGTLASGAPATYAVWDVPGGYSGGLPNLEPGTPLPQCVGTVVSGDVVHEREGALA